MADVATTPTNIPEPMPTTINPSDPTILASENPQHVQKLHDEYQKAANTAKTKFIGDQIRKDYGVPDASDAEAFAVYHQVAIPDATPQELAQVTDEVYGKKFQAPPKPSWFQEGLAGAQDWGQSIINQVLSIPKIPYEFGKAALSGGLELAPTQPGQLLTFKATTPEAQKQLAQGLAHIHEGGVFAAGMIPAEFTGGLVNPVVNSAVARMGAGFLPRLAAGAVKGASTFGAFGGGSAAAEAATEPKASASSIAAAFAAGFKGQALTGAVLGGLSVPVGDAAKVIKRAWAAGDAAKNAATLPQAKSAAAKAANVYQGEWGGTDGDPKEIATKYITDLHGPDVVNSDAGTRAINVIAKKITAYRDDLVQSLKKAPESDLSKGDPSEWVSAQEKAATKQKMSPDGPVWMYVTNMGEGQLEAHNVVAPSLEEATSLAQAESEKYGGKLLGEVSPEYEKYVPPIEQRVTPGESPTGVERRQSTMDKDTANQLIKIKNDAIKDLDYLETASADDLKKMYAEQNPGKEMPADTETMRDELKGETQARLSGARALLGRSIGESNEILTPQTETAVTKTSPQLPTDLSGAKPRYGYGPRSFKLDFESDIDKALYIAAQTTKSARDADYRAFLNKAGYSDTQIDALGKQLKDTIKAQAKASGPDVDALQVKTFGEAQKPTPAPETPRPMPGPVAVTRSGFPVTPEAAEVIHRMRSDPAYKLAISTMGDSRLSTTIVNKAAQSAPMTVDELANWSGKPDGVTVVRANILREKLIENYQKATLEGRFDDAQQAHNDLLKTEPGYGNLTGKASNTPEIVKATETVAKKIADVQKNDTPYAQASKELDQAEQQAKKSVKQTKKGPPAPTWLRRIEDYSIMAKLWSPVLPPLKFTSDGLAYLSRASTKLIASGILKLGGDEAEAQASFKYAFGTLRGFKEGFYKFLDSFKRVPPEYSFLDRPMSEGEKARVSRYPLPMRATNPVRWLQGVTNAWGAVGHDAELYTRAYAQAVREGYKDQNLVNRVNELRAHPDEEWEKAATEVGKYYSGQEDPDRLLRLMQSFQNLPTMRFFIPVIKFPYNLTRMGVRLSPLGTLSPQAWEDIQAGGVKRADVIGRWATGAMISTAALALYHFGDLNGAYPKNGVEKAIWKQEGRVPWSMKIGDQYVKFDKLQPLGFFLQQIAAVHEAIKEQKFDKSSDLFTKLVYQYGHGGLNVPFMANLGSLFDVMNEPENKLQSFKQLVVTGFIPSFLREIRNQTDPVVRKPESIKEAVENMIPGLSQNVFASVKPLGQDVELSSNPLIRATKQATPFTPSDKTNLMRQVGWAPPLPNPKFKFHGEEAELTGAMKHRYLVDMGKAADAAMTSAMMDKNFANLPDIAKKRVLTEVTSRYQAGIHRTFEILSGVYGPEAEKYKPQAEAALTKIETELLHGGINAQ